MLKVLVYYVAYRWGFAVVQPMFFYFHAILYAEGMNQNQNLFIVLSVYKLLTFCIKKKEKVMDEYLKGLGTTLGQDFVVIKWPPWMEEECLHAQTSQTVWGMLLHASIKFHKNKNLQLSS